MRLSYDLSDTTYVICRQCFGWLEIAVSWSLADIAIAASIISDLLDIETTLRRNLKEFRSQAEKLHAAAWQRPDPENVGDQDVGKPRKTVPLVLLHSFYILPQIPLRTHSTSVGSSPDLRYLTDCTLKVNEGAVLLIEYKLTPPRRLAPFRTRQLRRRPPFFPRPLYSLSSS